MRALKWFSFPPCPRGFLVFAAGMIFLCLQLAAVAADDRARNPYPVGMRSFGVWEAESGERVDFSVWYPGMSTGSPTVHEGWEVEAGRRARPAPGFYPVILVSHDTASSRFANNDLATALAATGFIVIVPTHSDDNQHASSGIYTAEALRNRPRQLLRALDTVLGSPDFAAHADESRIGLLGVGFGSITVLQLAGAEPDFSRLQEYCPSEDMTGYADDAFCSGWSRRRLANLPAAMTELEREYPGQTFSPPLALFSPRLQAVAVPPEDLHAQDVPSSHLQRKISWWRRLFGDAEEEEATPATADPGPQQSLAVAASGAQVETPATSNFPLLLEFQGGPLFGGTDSGAPFVHIALPDSPQFRVTVTDDASGSMSSPDPTPSSADQGKKVYRRPAALRSVRAVALLAPAGGMVFSPEALAGVSMPVAMLEAGNDTLYPPSRHARAYRLYLPATPLVLTLPGVDHFSLFARCSRETLLNLGEACGRLTGVARQKAARQRDRFLISFFLSALGGPLPDAAPSGYVAAPGEK